MFKLECFATEENRKQNGNMIIVKETSVDSCVIARNFRQQVSDEPRLTSCSVLSAIVRRAVSV